VEHYAERIIEVFGGLWGETLAMVMVVHVQLNSP
jgi:hypothetical protein